MQNNCSKKSSPAIQRAGMELNGLAVKFEPLARTRHDLWKLFNQLRKKAEAKLPDIQTDQRDTHIKFKERGQIADKIAKRTGYRAASKRASKYDTQIHNICWRVIKMKPKTLADLAVQVRAFDYVAPEGYYDRHGGLHTFTDHFAKFARVGFIKSHENLR